LKLVVDSHTHTVSSGHAYSTVQENAKEAGFNGIEMFAVTDHGPALKGAPSLLHFWNLKAIPDTIYGVRVIKGVEANIINYSGQTDMPDEILRKLDFAIASFHDITIEPSTVEEHTNALIKALENPYIDAIAHPGNAVFQVDIDKVVRAAARNNKLIEINNHSFSIRKGSDLNCREFLYKCKEHGVRITCGSDAHISFDVGKLDIVKAMIDETGIPEELVMCSSSQKFEMYLQERKKRKL
jgi:putative hydrolase